MMESIHNLDLFIFILYFAVLFYIAVRASRRAKTESAHEFFVASGTLPWYAIGFSIIAAGISSEHFLGAVGYSYNFGLSVANWEWLNGPSLIILVCVFVPLYLRRHIVTMPMYLGRRFNGQVRTLFAVITILIYVFINLAGVIYSGGLALQAIFDMESILYGIWMVSIVGGVIAVSGGMGSVAWTNVFQSILLLGGGILVFVIGLFVVPEGWTGIMESSENNHLILPADHPEIPWPALIVLALSTNMWFFCTNQCINQATLGAKDEWHAKMGILFAGFLGILIPLADVFPGLIAKALDMDLANSDTAYISLVNELVPVGIRGIVFAGLCGAIISTIEALINACSTVASIDLYKGWWNKEAPDRQVIQVGRIVGLCVIIVGALWAPMVGTFDHLFQYFQQSWAFVAVPMVIVFFLGVLWKNYSNTAALLTLLLVFPMFIMPYLMQVFDVDLNAYIFAGMLFIVILLLSVVLSLLTPGTVNPEGSDYCIRREMIPLPAAVKEKYGPLQQIWLWILILLASYATLYYVFW